MRQSKTLSRLRSNQVVRICSLGNYLPSFVRHAAHFGFDCIWLDLEHRGLTSRDVQALLTAFRLYDIDCMVRPATREKAQLYRYLEDGASGLLIPHVSTADEARQLVASVKFPPLGNRGLDGAGLDCDYLLAGEDYPEHANRETFLVVQIETPQAVQNANAIAAIEGVDGLFVGPGDLGLRLRQAGDSISVEDAMQQVAAAATANNKAWGCPVASADNLRQRAQQGAQLLARGGDFMALMQSLEQWRSEYDGAD